MKNRNEGLRKAAVILGCTALIALVNACGHGEYETVMSEAAYITDISQVDESLDGQYVIIAGTPEVIRGAVDEDMGAKFKEPVIYRKGYKMLQNSDKKWTWTEMKYTETQPYGTRTLYGTAGIGAYKMTGEDIIWLFEAGENVVTEATAEMTGWIYLPSSAVAGKYLISEPLKNTWSEFSSANAGIKKIGYSSRSTEGIPSTVFGMLKDGYIVGTDEYEIVYKKGIYTQEEFIDIVCH